MILKKRDVDQVVWLRNNIAIGKGRQIWHERANILTILKAFHVIETQ